MANLDLWRGGRPPFSGLTSLQKAMNRLFDDFWEPMDLGGDKDFMESFDFTPSVDVQETDEHYIYSLDVPGVNKDDIKIEFANNNLVITGERKSEQKEKNKSGRYLEQRYGRFQRMFTLPGTVDPDKVEAQYQNGVLRVAIPKTAEMKARQIPISDGKTGIFQKLTGAMKGSDEKKSSASTATH